MILTLPTNQRILAGQQIYYTADTRHPVTWTVRRFFYAQNLSGVCYGRLQGVCKALGISRIGFVAQPATKAECRNARLGGFINRFIRSERMTHKVTKPLPDTFKTLTSQESALGELSSILEVLSITVADTKSLQLTYELLELAHAKLKACEAGNQALYQSHFNDRKAA